MSAQALFPLAQWQEGTNQNSTPANDNALRIEAIMGPAKGFADTEPPTPVDHDQWIVTTAWGGFTANNIVIYLGGTWKEFATFDGMIKTVDAVGYIRHGVWWDVIVVTGS